MSKRKKSGEYQNTFCGNCGNLGHTYKRCNLPITSCGVILFKNNENSLFTIKPIMSIENLRSIALKSSPPEIHSIDDTINLVDIENLNSSIKLDIRYATKNNFMQTKFYKKPKAFLNHAPAQNLISAHKELNDFGYGIVIYDVHYGNNLISYPLTSSQFVADALGDAASNVYAVASEGVAALNDPVGGWIGSLEAFEGGNGYWLVANSDFSFSFNCGSCTDTNSNDDGIARVAVEQPVLDRKSVV
jgi:hypothetical protein